VGGLLGKVMGGLGRGVGSAGTGMAMSFATTYALGQLAVRPIPACLHGSKVAGP